MSSNGILLNEFRCSKIKICSFSVSDSADKFNYSLSSLFHLLIILDYIDLLEMKSSIGKDIGRELSVEYLGF